MSNKTLHAGIDERFDLLIADRDDTARRLGEVQSNYAKLRSQRDRLAEALRFCLAVNVSPHPRRDAVLKAFNDYMKPQSYGAGGNAQMPNPLRYPLRSEVWLAAYCRGVEDAAKTACVFCLMTKQPLSLKNGQWMHYEEPCGAGAIRALLPEPDDE